MKTVKDLISHYGRIDVEAEFLSSDEITKIFNSLFTEDFEKREEKIPTVTGTIRKIKP